MRRIGAKKLCLPAIQRKFVWDAWQIERLFDSIMRDYRSAHSCSRENVGFNPKRMTVELLFEISSIGGRIPAAI